MEKKRLKGNKLVAKNAALLYFRMLISIIVGLYTSRIVLQTLGVDDFGIYGLVGGVVSMFSFLNASMSGATSRFIIYQIGKNNKEDLRNTFCTAFILHAIIALFIFIILETVGLWLINNKLVIPENRIFAANVVYQLSIISMLVTVTQVPYNASIISHEKMDVYAYVELLNVLLKLGIVFLLSLGNFDRLIIYAILILIVSIMIAFLYRLYCVKHFEECKFRWYWNKEFIKPMIIFSGWDLYGNMCVTFRQYGINMVINVFFGVALNAASAIATQVNSALFNLSSNVVQAFRPQIIKSYSQKEYSRMQSLVCNAIVCSSMLYNIMAIPLIICMQDVLQLWLGFIPDYTIEFCRLLICTGLVILINSIINIIIHASGDVKLLSFLSGSILLINLLFVYILFKFFTNNPNWAYILWLIFMPGVLFMGTLLARRQVRNLNYKIIVIKIIGSLLLPICSGILTNYITSYFEKPILHFIIVLLVNTAVISILGYILLLDKHVKEVIHLKLIEYKNKVS